VAKSQRVACGEDAKEEGGKGSCCTAAKERVKYFCTPLPS